MSPHRNAPCPCGSGEKYKRCCGASSSWSEDPTAATRQSALDALLRFGARSEFTDAMLAGLELCLGEPFDPEDDPIREHPISANLMAFLHFDHEIEDGKNLIDIYLERRASRSLTAAARHHLEELRDSCFGLYEVLEVHPEKGGRLRDLWQGGELVFEDENAAQSMQPWDVVVTRVVPRPSGVHRFESDMLTFPTDSKAALLAQLEEDHHAMIAREPDLAPERFLGRAGYRFIRAWLRGDANEPTFVTPEGELVEPTTLIFSIGEREAVVEALGHVYLEDEEDEDAWIIADEDEDEDDEKVRHAAGRAWIEDDLLFVEVMTRSRGEEERAFVENRCGGAVHHEETRTISFEHFLEENPPEEEDLDDDESHEPTEDDLRIFLRRRDRHYRRWVDEEIPALSDHSPRAIAADPELAHLRPALVELLKQAENREARFPPVEGHPYDFAWIWEELGLERPAGAR